MFSTSSYCHLVILLVEGNIKIVFWFFSWNCCFTQSAPDMSERVNLIVVFSPPNLWGLLDPCWILLLHGDDSMWKHLGVTKNPNAGGSLFKESLLLRCKLIPWLKEAPFWSPKATLELMEIKLPVSYIHVFIIPCLFTLQILPVKQMSRHQKCVHIL